MCGIVGTVGRTLPPDAEARVRAMLATVRHRGPDGDGFHVTENAAFGHARLAIIDIAGGAQPQTTEDGRYTLVFNGQIYNYVELRQELEQAGVTFRTRSDTEVLLKLLARDGEAGLRRLVGMFAFAFWDNVKRELLLVRDHFGVKPLYYHETADGDLVFASEIKALLVDPRIEARRDPHAFSEYLTFQLCLDDRTLFAGIRKLPPSSVLRWRVGGRAHISRYWDLHFHVDEDHTEHYFLERLDALMEESVRMQMRSDVAVGAYLSGGLDSSLVSALASTRHGGRPLEVFHGRFDAGRRYDESHYARVVANAIGAVYNEVVPTPADFVATMPGLIRAMDEPAAGPGLFPQHLVSKAAREKVTVVLGGQGGDEVFAGYARYLVAYLEQALKGSIYETQEERQHLVTLASIVPNLAVLREYVPMLKSFWAGGLFDDMDRRYYRLVNRMPDMADVLSPSLQRQMDGDAIFSAFQQEFNHPDTLSYINKMTHFDLRTQMPALLQVEDRVSMVVSLESRVPLLDHRIVELVTTMPPALKFAGGRLKPLLKRMAGKHLPAEVVTRKDKMGFPVPLSEWLRTSPVREFVADTVLSRAARERDLFRPEAVEKLISAEAPFGRQLWAMLCLELWFNEFGVA